MGYGLEMRRVDTADVAAKVIKFEAFWNWTDDRLEDDTTGLSRFAINEEPCITRR